MNHFEKMTASQNTSIFSYIKVNIDIVCVNKPWKETFQGYLIISLTEFNHQISL